MDARWVAAVCAVVLAGCGSARPEDRARREGPVSRAAASSSMPFLPTFAAAGASRCRPGPPVDLGPARSGRAWAAFGRAGGFVVWNGETGWVTRALALDGTPTGQAVPFAAPTDRGVPNRFVALDDGRFVALFDEYVAERTPREATFAGVVDARGALVGAWTHIEGLAGVEVFDAMAANDRVAGVALRNGAFETERRLTWFDVSIDAGGAGRATARPLVITFHHAEQLLPGTFFEPVRGDGPPSWLVLGHDEVPVQLMVDGRVRASRTALPAGVVGLVAAWDGPRVRIAFRDASTPAGQARTGVLEADGELRLGSRGSIAQALRPPLVDEVDAMFELGAGWSTLRKVDGTSHARLFGARVLDGQASEPTSPAYLPETAWTGERFLVTYVLRRGDERVGTARVVAMDCRPR